MGLCKMLIYRRTRADVRTGSIIFSYVIESGGLTRASGGIFWCGKGCKDYENSLTEGKKITA
ncbi:hypothetical protein DET54_11929 [Paenibacillus pabuli]|uniref:Uncharacterized protein n=1 Tax=Paenibacillus pabuli TaxID=1472 RepID=A0A855YI48_9BACL|nr:hypothetical protein DET56_101639 [Paenibacillus pabuli]PXW11767.1 hypothetical protein DEU73_101638 [Paenibacillus taichungensis]RAI86086.1 hypothetical protein DET54_11929 [Paenibacillus pabuli]